MGFGVGGLFGDAVANPAAAPASLKIKVTDAEKKYLNCSHCPLDRAALVHGKMQPEGAKRPTIYVLGETPTQADDKQGTHFGSPSGQFLRARFPADADDITRWNYVLRCAAGSDRQSLLIECCRKLQVADIEQTQPAVILSVGPLALHWLVGSDKQMHIWRGRRAPVRVGKHVCWAYFVDDPAEIMQKLSNRKYGDANLAAFDRDLRRVFDDVERGLPEACVELPADYQKGVELLTVYGADGLQRVEQVLATYRDAEHAHDIETNGLQPYSPEAKILSIAIGTYAHTFSFAWEHSEARWSAREHKLLAEMLRAYIAGSGLKWAHAAKFEQEWWHYRYGQKVVYDTRWGDTLGQAHVIDERGGDEDKAKAKGLGELTQLHLGFNVKALSPVDRKKLATTPLHYVLPYNALDTKYTHAISVIQGAILDDLGMQHVYDRLNGFTASTVTMQAKGVVRNVPFIKKLDADLGKKEQAAIAKIYADKDVQAFRNTGRKFEPLSNPDLIVFFRDFLKIEGDTRRKKKGDTKYSVDDDALSKIGHPVAGLISDLRTVTKHRGYVTPLNDGGKYVSPDGLVHASYSQYITGSGRYACKNPNQQNYPRRGPEAKIVRRVIGCPPGHRFYAFDYGQLEWRIGAALSRDRFMIDELRDRNADIHGRWTDDLGKAFAPAMLKANRKGLRDALKNDWTFSNLYGNTPDAIAYMLGKIFAIDLRTDALMPHYENFWGTYPGLKAYQDGLLKKYWQLGYVETGTGQRRHEPLARNELINHPFQGTGGHLVIDAQARISRFAYESARPSLQPIMNIHDDLSFYFPDATAERDVEDVARLMLTGLFPFVDVPMLVECSVGENWADKEEIGKFYSDDFTC